MVLLKRGKAWLPCLLHNQKTTIILQGVSHLDNEPDKELIYVDEFDELAEFEVIFVVI